LLTNRRATRLPAAQRGHLQTPPCNHEAKFLGMVRVWREGDLWKWVPADSPAPENAVLGERLQTDDEEVIYILRDDGGDFIRGAVKEREPAE
jgi:hypothetical protein